jgi:8-amino-7-oxononanoate synthase
MTARDQAPYAARIDAVRAQREADGLRRRLNPRTPDFDGLIDLASNDYLGLTRDVRVQRAAADAAATWGTGATGSRLVTGTTQLHTDFEDELAAFVGAEAALVVSSGYAANLAAITALAPAGTHLISDAINHASIVDACRLARGEVSVVPHRDPAAIGRRLDELASGGRGEPVIVTDAVFSVDGEAAPLTPVIAAADAHHALLIVDEAHSLGVVGDHGSGAMAALGAAAAPAHVITATLSKAFASQGGAILGSRAVIDHVIDQARPFIFDTGLAPTSVAAAREALRLMRADGDLPAQARANARHLSSLATSVGLAASVPDAAVVSIRVGAPQDALAAQTICREHGVLVGCFRPPSVPDSDSRLRLTARADLDEPTLATVGAALAAVAAHLAG